jgi:3D (Asp-Asp-Asp) domain-containing protein
MYKTILWKQRRRKEIREKVEKTLIRIIFVLMFLLGIYGFYCGIQQQLEHVQAAGLTPAQMINSGEIYRVECTAYDNEEGNLTASGRPTVEGLTMAGAREWLGCTCILYDENMNFVGFYEFTDTGYGRDGDIERGETIDIYMDSHEEALQWGRRIMYIQIVRSEG